MRCWSFGTEDDLEHVVSKRREMMESTEICHEGSGDGVDGMKFASLPW